MTAGDYADADWDVVSEAGSVISVSDASADENDDVLHTQEGGEQPMPPHVEILDSGTSRHLSPYRDDFNSMRDIPPQTLRAANKGNFSAIGAGELTIEVPDGVDVSKLQLHEVLYSPKVGYTLISVGKLDEQGFTLTFGGGKCVITAPDGERIGQVPKNAKGLYRPSIASIGRPML